MNKILMLMISVIFSFSSALAEESQRITDEGTATTTITAVIEPSFSVLIPQQYKDEELAKSVKLSGNIDESSVKISHSLVSKKIMNYSIKIN